MPGNAPIRVGRYALHRPIAAGGMATVHIGRLLATQGLSRVVAIKRLHAQFARDPELQAMLLDEARLAMRIHHPNVVPTLDVVSEDGELLLVMEYVRGEALSTLLRLARTTSRRLPLRVISAIVTGALTGLHAAHEAKGEDGQPLGIVHRDVSPHNILVGSDGVSRVLDFGVAKAIGRMQTTRDGQIKGKLAYMAPEQLAGGEVDRRADVFAASIVLWEAIVGRRLFDGTSAGAVVSAVLSQEIPSPAELSDDCPPALAALVMRGLERHRDLRFATARELALALETAVPPATQREVGERVEELVAEVLVERDGMVDAMERPSPPSGRTGSSVMTTTLSSTDGVDRSGVSQVSSFTQPAKTGRARRNSVIALLLLLVGAALGAVLWATSRTSTAVATQPGAAPPPSAPASPSALVPSSSPSAPGSTPSPPASTSTPTPTSIAATAATASGKPSKKPPPAPTKKKPAIDCTNPFTIDDRGIRVPRPECF